MLQLRFAVKLQKCSVKLRLTLHEQMQAEFSIILLNLSFSDRNWCQTRVNAIGTGSQNISGHAIY